MNELNVKLVRIINGYDPNKRDMLCKIDIIKLSQMEALQNPTSEKRKSLKHFWAMRAPLSATIRART